MEFRSSDVNKILRGETYTEVKQYDIGSRLPTGLYLLGRIISLCKTVKGQKSMSKHVATSIVASEVSRDWIGKNVYPVSERTVAKRLMEDYELLRSFMKVEDNVENKSEEWKNNARKFNEKMTKTAYDIRCENRDYERYLEEKFNVKMNDNDKKFYENNCHGDYTYRCSDRVSAPWMKQQKRLDDRRQMMEAQRMNDNETRQHQSEIDMKEVKNALADMNDDGAESDFQCSEKPDDCSRSPDRDSEHSKFPKVKIRDGRKTFNEPLMRCLVQCLSEYDITPRALMGTCVAIANNVFGQNWSVSEDDADGIQYESSDSDEGMENQPDMQQGRKRKRATADRTFIMPTRKTVDNYVKDAAFLNLEYVAECLRNKSEDTVVTIGVDDTVKAAGNRLFDVKTDYITIGGPDGKSSLTTGYTPNMSHSGADAAAAYRYRMKSLAALVDCTEDELLEQVDFWMSDRAGDCATMLRELGINNEQVLKCCAHIILGIDSAIEKVFKDTEQRVGLERIIDCTKILLSSSSMHTLGLIAITKLLSPSHASHSVSLYTDFIEWMNKHGIQHDGFTGFVGNRFGRIAELAQKFTTMKDTIMQFFNDIVDEHSNKLVLAVATFISNDWFICSTEVYSLMGQIIIFPIMNYLGIDGRESAPEGATWDGFRTLCKEKLEQLARWRDDFGKTTTGKGRLINAVLIEILNTVNRQLKEMDFFNPDVNSHADENKLKFAPLTNLGCESQFARLDNKVRIAGGSTSLQTHSRKAVIAKNGLLVNPTFSEQNAESKHKKWKWARNSEQVARAREVEKEFLEKVQIARQLSVKKKEDLKKKKNANIMKALDTCKLHGGPISPSNLDILYRLNEKQLLVEIGFLRLTVAPCIRQKRRVQIGNKFKYQNFTVDELRAGIKSTVQPENKVEDDLDELLKSVLVK